MGAAVAAQQSLKHVIYTPLRALAEKQWVDGRRAAKPEFFPAVCSTVGECSKGLWQLLEQVVAIYSRRLAREGARLDGLPTAQLTAAFRTSLKVAVQVAVAKGIATMLISAGLPMALSQPYSFSSIKLV